MWRILSADFCLRLAPLSVGMAVIGLASLGFDRIAGPSVPVLRWAIASLVVYPLLLNATAAGADAREGRMRLQLLLPVPAWQIAAVRCTVPLLIQGCGSLIAIGVCMASAAVGAAEILPLATILWMSAGLLLLGQWLFLQRELTLRAGSMSIVAHVLGGVGSLAALGALFAVLFTVFRAGLLWLPMATLEQMRRAMPGTAGLAAVLVTSAAALIINTWLYVRRDALTG